MNNQSEKKITINQIAEYCGVSKTTVSRFLNGKYGNMSAETKSKINAAVLKYNFRPDRSAQRLKSRQSMLIGCVMGDVSSPFSALLLKGISSVCEQAGYQVLFADSSESAKRERRAIQELLDNRVDGLIINTCGENDNYLIELSKSGTPLVLADRPIQTSGIIDTVSSDDLGNAKYCVRLLIEKGYKHIAFFAESIGSVSPRVFRCKGYIEGIEEYAQGAVPEIYELCKSGSNDSEAIEDFKSKYQGERVAIISTNGVTSQRILVAMKSMGIKAGYDFGLCTFDDWEWLKIADPSITAVAQGTVDIGARAAKLLLERISGKLKNDVSPENIIVETRLMLRESTPGEK